MMFIKFFLNKYFTYYFNKVELKPLDLPLKTNQHYNTDILYSLCLHKPVCLFLSKLIEEETTENTKINILDFYGSNSGKSKPKRNLKEFATNSLYVYDKSEKNNNGKIYFETEQDFLNNTKSIGKRFNDINNLPIAYHFKWNDKKFLNANDQSHHIAAVYRQSCKQGLEYKICCDLRTYNINKNQLLKLKKEYFVYFCDSEYVYILKDYLEKIFSFLCVNLKIKTEPFHTSIEEQKNIIFIPKKTCFKKNLELFFIEKEKKKELFNFYNLFPNIL